MAHSKIIGNIDDLKRAADNVYKGKKSASKIVDDLILGKRGTGSFVLDKLVNSSKKRTGKLANNINKTRMKISDLDMRAGAKMHNIIGKGLDKKENLKTTDRLRKNIANSFSKEYTMNISKANGINPGMQAKVNAGSLTEPIIKAKNKIIPLVGSMTVADSLSSKYKKQEGGENKVASNNTDDLIEKIAGCKPNTPSLETQSDKTDRDTLLKKSYDMLKTAYEHINQLEEYCEKLAIENQSLHLDLVQKEKHDEAVKIAEEMHSKGLIKKADMDDKINDIAAMDDESLSLFKRAMEDVVVPQFEGISDLTFIMDKDNIKSKDNMVDVFSKIN